MGTDVLSCELSEESCRTMPPRRARRKVGDILKIDLGDGTFSFGRVLPEPLVAFYDSRSSIEPEIEEILSAKIAFKIWVMNLAITSGRWAVIGSLPLEEHLKAPPMFFKQDPVNGELTVYHLAVETPATREECEGLERAAVWSPEHVEDRLRDFYAKAPNRWVESLQLRPE